MKTNSRKLNITLVWYLKSHVAGNAKKKSDLNVLVKSAAGNETNSSLDNERIDIRLRQGTSEHPGLQRTDCECFKVVKPKPLPLIAVPKRSNEHPYSDNRLTSISSKVKERQTLQRLQEMHRHLHGATL